MGGCNPPVSFLYYFSGAEGDCIHFINGPSACIAQSGVTTIALYLTAGHVGNNDFSYVLATHSTGHSSVGHVTIFVHGCGPDPTFLGGDPFPETLPAPASPLVEAFSPGIPGSVKSLYQRSYLVFGSQATVSIIVRDAAGNLVRTLASNTVLPSGAANFIWDGKDDTGALLPEGTYTYAVAQQNLGDASSTSIFTGYAAIDNTPPSASITDIAVDDDDPTLFDILGAVSDTHLVSYQIERATSSAGPYTLTTVSSVAPQDETLSSISQTYFSPGVNFVRLTATDAAGLAAVVVKSFTVNTSTAGLAGVPVQVGALTQSVLNAGGANPPADNPSVFVEDALPAAAAGTAPAVNWSFVNTPVYSGALSHTDTFADNQPGARLHYFTQASPGHTPAVGENIIQYVYLDPVHPPQELLLAFYTDQGNAEHRVYWGANAIQTTGTPGTPSLLNLGGMPAPGQWIRLKIPAALLNLEGKTIKGIVFGAYGGRATWDKTTTSTNGQDAQTANAAVVPAPSGINSVATTLAYTLPRAANLNVDVINFATGALVKNVASGFALPGTYSAAWDQTDSAGAPEPDGDYFFRFSSPDGPIDSQAIVFAGTQSYTSAFAPTVTDADQNVYRLDPAHKAMIKTNGQGLLLKTLPLGGLGSPSGLALDPSGALYVQTSSGAARFDVGRVNFSARTLNASLRIPWDNALVRATVPIVGGASGRNFASYTVEIAPTWNPSSFTVLNQGFSQVVDNFEFPGGFSTVYGNLASWETGLVSGEEYPAQDLFHPAVDSGYHGRWTIRLRADSTDGHEAVASRKVIIGRVVNNATGGLIVSDDAKARVRVPALALQDDWDIFGLVTATTTAPAYMPAWPPALAPVSSMYEFIPAAYQFKQPTTLDIAATAADLTVNGTPVPSAQVGLYVYNPDSGLWTHLPTKTSVFTDSTTQTTATLFTDASLTAIPNFDGFYALFADTAPAPSPIVNPLPSVTPQFSILVSGSAKPLTSVNLYLLTGTASSTTVRATFPVDGQGAFSGNLVFPSAGAFTVAAADVNVSGSVGALSAAQNILVALTVPPSISSLQFKDVNFSSAPLSALQRGAPVYVEMQAADIDPVRPDTVYATLSSSLSDPAGIVVALTQVSNTSTLYRGTAYLGNVSDPAFMILAAASVGETISVKAQTNVSISATLPLRDLTLPAAPAVFSPTHPSVFQDTFEKDLSQWQTYNIGAGASVSLDSATSATGQTSVRLTQLASGGDFSTRISARTFDLRATPIVAFDYLFPAAPTVPRFNFFFRRNGILHEVSATDLNEGPKNLAGAFANIGSITTEFAGYSATHGRYGKIDQIAGDNQWHHLEFNLLAMFKNLYPKDTQFSIDQIFLADFNQTQFYGMVPGNTPVGDTIHLDNFAVRSAGGSAAPVFVWSPPAGAIAGYSIALDQNAGTVPPEVSVGTGTVASFTGLASGVYYFHVRAENALGLWGPANHYTFLVDTDPPVLSNPSPAPTLPLARTDQTTAVLSITDASGIDPDSLSFTVNGASYTYASGGVSFDVQSGSLTLALSALLPAPIIHDGDIVTVAITDLADFAGNHIAAPYSWSWQADFSAAAGGGFGPVTFNGGKDPAWSPDSQRLAFASNRFGNDDLFVASSNANGDVIESSATLTRLTSSNANENQPTWSPDGARLAFVSDATGAPQIWLAASNGSGVATQLSASAASDTHPSWSADGSEIYFSRSTAGLGNLWAIDIDTRTWTKAGEHAVTTDDIGFDLDSRISPDGTTLAYRRSLYVDNIRLVNANGLNGVALTVSGKDHTPNWSPDGKQVVFASQRNSTADQLWLMDATGLNARLLLDNLNTWPENEPAWSPDGGRIAFTTTRSGAANVWILSVLQLSGITATPAIFAPGAVNAGAKKTVTISYDLSASSAIVSLDILNATTGATVNHLLAQQSQRSGAHSVVWNGLNTSGNVIADGPYIAYFTVTGPAALDPIVRQITFKADSTPPAVSVGGASGGFGPGTFYNPSTVFFVSANDSSGIQEVDLAIDATTQFSAAPSTFTLSVGTHTLAFRAIDTVGNVNGPLTESIGIDDQPPVSTITYQGASYITPQGDVFISSSTVFTLSGVDGSSSIVVSGLYHTTATLDGQSYTQSAPFTLSVGDSEGAHALQFSSIDNAGNTEPSHAVSLIVDVTAPTAAAAASPPLFFNGSHSFATASTAFSLNAQDPQSSGSASGVQSQSYSVDGSLFSVYASSFALPLGSHALRFYATDHVGNVSAVQELDVIVAAQLPKAILVISTPSFTSAGTHYASAATQFSLTRSSGAPVDYFELNIDSAGFKSVASTNTFSFASQGSHSLAFYAVSGGVADATDTYSVVIDSTPPASAISFGDGQAGSFLRPDTIMTLTSSDTIAGAQAITFSIDGTQQIYSGPFSFTSAAGLSSGAHVLKWFAQDRLGNTETAHTLNVTLDSSGPSVSLQFNGGQRYFDGVLNYASGDTGFVFTATDAVSGVAQIFVDAGLGAGYQLYTGSITFVGQGQRTLNYYAVDNVGNGSALAHYQVYIDTQGPAVSAAPSIPAVLVNGITYIRAGTGFAITTAADNLSGSKSVSILADGAPVGSPAFFSAEGPHTLGVAATDQVGNVTTPALHLNLVVDNTPPVSRLVVDGATQSPGAVVSISTASVLSLASTDALSAVATAYYRLDGAAIQLFSGSPFSLAATAGTHTFNIWAVDLVGNTETPENYTLVISSSLGTPSSPAVTGFIQSASLGLLRNNFDGWVGFTFTVGNAPMQISALGRLVAPGNTGAHTVKIVDASGADVPGASVTVNTLGTANGQFAYAALASSVTLPENGTYFLVSSETSNGDAWYDDDTTIVTSTAAVVRRSAYALSTGPYYAVGNANTAYVPLDFRYVLTAPTVAEIPADAFVRSQSLGSLRNNFSGWIGFRFTVGPTPMQINQLGRIIALGNKQTHDVKLVDASGFDIPGGLTTVNTAGGSPGQFAYAALPNPVTLPAHGTYFLVSSELADGDRWYDLDTTLVTSTAAAVTQSVFATPTGAYYSVGDPNTSYIPVDFRYVYSSTAPPVPVIPPDAFVREKSLGSSRNNFSGWIGFRFTVGAQPIQINQLGRIISSGNKQTHDVKLVDVSGFDIPGGLTTVNTAGGSPGQFAYAALPNPVTLPTNGTYFLVSSETTGGDTWYDLNTTVVTSTAAAVTQSVFANPTGAYYSVGDPNTSYIPVDFRYVYSSTAPPIPVIPADAFVRGKTLGSLRNNFSGWIGFEFTVGSTPMQINQLGRIVVAGNTRTHDVKLVDATGTDIPGGLATVNTAAGSPGQFVYTPLFNPVTLPANGTYFLVSAETFNGDAWYDYNTTVVTSTAAVVAQSVYANPTGAYYPVGAANTSYIPVDFRYVISADAGHVGAGAPPSRSAASAAFSWGEVYVFPNPARSGARPTFHIEAGIVDSIALKIFNIAGELVFQTTLASQPALIDDGSGRGPQYAYEYVWDGHIASGIYFYVIDAQKSGARERKRGKFSVIR